MSQREVLAVAVVADKEVYCSAQRFPRATKTAAPPLQAFEVGPQVRLQALFAFCWYSYHNVHRGEAPAKATSASGAKAEGKKDGRATNSPVCLLAVGAASSTGLVGTLDIAAVLLAGLVQDSPTACPPAPV